MLTETTSQPVLGSGFSGLKAITAGVTTIAAAHPVITTALIVGLGTSTYWSIKTRKLKKQVRNIAA